MDETHAPYGPARTPHRRAGRTEDQRAVQRPRPNPDARLRLVCLPYSGGRASAFTGLAAELPDDVELCAIELPGHGRRLVEPPLTQLRPLVEQLTDGLAAWIRRPFVLLGYSVGALIGFETVREFARRGLPGPSALFVASARAPHLPSARPPLHRLPRGELLKGLHRLAGRHNELLDDEELVDVVLPVLRADLGLDETYAYEPGTALDCPIAAFGGSEDWTLSRADLEAWGERTTGEFSATTLPGGHFFLESAQGLFAEAVTDGIRRFADGPDAGDNAGRSSEA